MHCDVHPLGNLTGQQAPPEDGFVLFHKYCRKGNRADGEADGVEKNGLVEFNGFADQLLFNE